MKKSAWTLAELAIAIIIMLLLCAASMSISKNISINRSKVYLYAALRNLTMGNIAITEMPVNGGYFYPGNASNHDASATTDWYCLYLADSFSLAVNPECEKTTDTTGLATVNLRFPNGITFQGIASEWKTMYDGLFYKDFIVDADGEKGSNKIGIDRYPMRVFRGNTLEGIPLDGMIMPVECGNDYTYDVYDTRIELSSPYCVHGFEVNGAAARNNIASDSSILSKNIYRVTDAKNTTRASIIAGSLSTIEADCKAHAGKGFYTAQQCADYGINLLERCAHERMCQGCKNDTLGFNICPNGETEEKCLEYAADNLVDGTPHECFSLLNKPTAGLGIIAGGAVGDMEL